MRPTVNAFAVSDSPSATALPRRTPFIGALDKMIRAGRAMGVLQRANLDMSALMDNAVRETGLNDFGDPWFKQPFGVLIDALNNEADLNAAGEFAAMQSFRKILNDRLWAQDWFRRHPEIMDRPIASPVVIVGPMRSGTTRLHRLLASDQRFSHMRSFETISPVPPPDFKTVLAGDAPDARHRIAKRIERLAKLANPRTLSIHPTGPMEPEEELGLLVNSLWGMKQETQWQIPSYSRWCEGQDATPAYQHLARLLKLVEWSQQAPADRPWILKTPQHMLDLPALLNVFPDARLIFTHRDPHCVVASAASLSWNQTIIYSDHVDPHRLGREWLRKTELQVESMRRARKSIPAKQMIDVQYADVERDWRVEIKRIYRFIGSDIAPAWSGLEGFMAGSHSVKRKAHQYSLEQFGLIPEEVTRRFAGYVHEYAVPNEGAGDRNVGNTAEMIDRHYAEVKSI